MSYGGRGLGGGRKAMNFGGSFLVGGNSSFQMSFLPFVLGILFFSSNFPNTFMK